MSVFSLGLEKQVRIADVDILFRSNRVVLFWDDVFKPAESEPRAQVTLRFIKAVEWKGNTKYVNCEEVRKNGNTIYWNILDTRLRYRVLDMAEYSFIRVAGHLAGSVSDTYVMCNGAGINVGGIGVVLFGYKGKSTLSAMLNGEVLDDDLVMINSDSMQTIGRTGVSTDGKHVKRMEGSRTDSPLDIMIHLDSTRDPDYVQEVDISDSKERARMAEHAFDDRNFHSLKISHTDRMKRFQWPKHIFEIGTKREPNESREAIGYILSCYK